MGRTCRTHGYAYKVLAPNLEDTTWDDDDAVALQPRPGLGLPFGFHDSLY
jgi:hypothetical protein